MTDSTETREQLGARLAAEAKPACLAEADGPSCCCCPACCSYCREWAVDFALGVNDPIVDEGKTADAVAAPGEEHGDRPIAQKSDLVISQEHPKG